MVPFLNEHPNRLNVKRKLHPYHIISCCVYNIICQIELVETEKDWPKKAHMLHLSLKIKCLRPQHYVVGWQNLFGGFGYMATLPELHKKVLFGKTVFKKKEPEGRKLGIRKQGGQQIPSINLPTLASSNGWKKWAMAGSQCPKMYLPSAGYVQKIHNKSMHQEFMSIAYYDFPVIITLLESFFLE